MSKPNLLIICTDQQRYDTLGCYGNPIVETANLDRLASQGALFERCYVQNPVCAPSRATFFTGLYPRNHGLWANGVALPPSHRLFTRLLADSGYDCGLVGKLHLAAGEHGRTEPRPDDGFRVFHRALDPEPGSPENQYHHWLAERFPDVYQRLIAKPPQRFRKQPNRFKSLPRECHYSHWVSERTMDFLRRERRSSQPFFFMANFFDPHHAFGAPEEYLARYRDLELPAPRTRPCELESKPAPQRAASEKSYAGYAPGYREYSTEELRDIRAAYYAMVDLIDDEVGAIVACLDELGLRDDTLVVFTSDHGEMLGDHQLLLKGPMMYEPAVRVPLLMRWPGRLPAGMRRDELVQWIDLPTTFLTAAGVQVPSQFQGADLLGLGAGDASAWGRDWALCEYRNSGHPYQPPVHTTMLRSDRYKLVLWHGSPATRGSREGELYDLEGDPDELENRWDAPSHGQIRQELVEKLTDVLVATEDRAQPREANW